MLVCSLIGGRTGPATLTVLVRHDATDDELSVLHPELAAVVAGVLDREGASAGSQDGLDQNGGI
ncbi:MAG TPA: hypothetical protein VGL39_23260 [Jatrophihabitantaceae bacterium]